MPPARRAARRWRPPAGCTATPARTRSTPGWPRARPGTRRQGAHSHTYPPFDLRLFTFKDGCYYFIGDPKDFGYQGQTYSYYGAHPVLDHYGGGWCFMVGGHAHWWRPWSPVFRGGGPLVLLARALRSLLLVVLAVLRDLLRPLLPALLRRRALAARRPGGVRRRGGWTAAPPIGRVAAPPARGDDRAPPAPMTGGAATGMGATPCRRPGGPPGARCPATTAGPPAHQRLDRTPRPRAALPDRPPPRRRPRRSARRRSTPASARLRRPPRRPASAAPPCAPTPAASAPPPAPAARRRQRRRWRSAAAAPGAAADAAPRSVAAVREDAVVLVGELRVAVEGDRAEQVHAGR